MTEVVVSVDVAAPAGTTWLALTDWTRQSEWMLGTEVHVTEGNGRSVGSQLTALTGIAGIGVVDAMEITVWEPPVRCAVRHQGTLIRGTGAFHVHDRGPQRCTCVWSERLTLPMGPLGRLGSPLVRPILWAGLRRSLTRFVAFAESYR